MGCYLEGLARSVCNNCLFYKLNELNYLLIFHFFSMIGRYDIPIHQFFTIGCTAFLRHLHEFLDYPIYKKVTNKLKIFSKLKGYV